MMRLVFVCAALAALSACTSSPVATTAPRPDTAVEAMDPRARTLDQMLEQAQADRLAGALPAAEATLEAALRIAPADARLWLELAELQFATGDYEAAQTIAGRAMTLAGGNSRIIAAAREIRERSARNLAL